MREPDQATLAAKQAIRDLVLAYSHGIDRRDYDLVASLYHPDAEEDHGGMFRGPASEFLQWLPSILETMTLTAHQVLNHWIAVDGEQAEGEVYCQAWHLHPDEQGNDCETIVGGRYLDRYERRAGDWRFSYRRIVADWHQINTPGQYWDAPMFAGTPRGSSGSEDPAKGFFHLLGRS